jgi:predicted nucleic acid-binding protein
MNGAVVDTDVVSFVFKNDSRAETYASHLENRLLVVSFMTIAELERWPVRRGWSGVRRQRLERFLDDYVVVHSGRALCREWAEVSEQCRRQGRPINCGDAWIAATALYYGLPLITHNREDFAAVRGLTLISEAPH